MAAKDALVGKAKDARAWGLERWLAFRAESPFFQAKVALVAAYVVIVVLTLLIAPPRGGKWTAQQDRLPFGLAFKTALIVTNLRNGDLDDVVVEVSGKGIEFDGKQVPGVWHTKPLSMPEQLKTQILPEQLYDDRGINPPYSLVIDSARVLDRKKKLLVELHPKQVSAQ